MQLLLYMVSTVRMQCGVNLTIGLCSNCMCTIMPLLLSLLLLQAEAFAISRQQNQADTYARAVARAIQSGGGSATIAYASAFAKALQVSHSLLLWHSLMPGHVSALPLPSWACCMLAAAGSTAHCAVRPTRCLSCPVLQLGVIKQPALPKPSLW